jgi:hypothetical protein
MADQYRFMNEKDGILFPEIASLLQKLDKVKTSPNFWFSKSSNSNENEMQKPKPNLQFPTFHFCAHLFGKRWCCFAFFITPHLKG